MAYTAFGWVPPFFTNWFTAWYTVQVGSRFLTPRKLSRATATEWALDQQELNWNTTVRLFELRDGRWLPVF
jgi:hypothetical protein